MDEERLAAAESIVSGIVGAIAGAVTGSPTAGGAVTGATQGFFNSTKYLAGRYALDEGKKKLHDLGIKRGWTLEQKKRANFEYTLVDGPHRPDSPLVFPEAPAK